MDEQFFDRIRGGVLFGQTLEGDVLGHARVGNP
jgi:hypothetical protein